MKVNIKNNKLNIINLKIHKAIKPYVFCVLHITKLNLDTPRYSLWDLCPA